MSSHSRSSVRDGLWSALIFIALLLTGMQAQQAFAGPLAGDVIGNQASATYTDAAGITQTTTSNLVETIVDQVYGVAVEADRDVPSAPGTTVYLPHTVTNTGNGSDIYDLLAAQVGGGDFSFTGLIIYADANGDGVPDSFTPITITPSIPAGGSFGIVIAAQVPNSAVSGEDSQLTITATSQGDGNQSDLNTDTVTITDGAVIPVTKELSAHVGPAGTTLTVTLRYTNSGTATAIDLTLTDLLDARFNYVPDSGRWSVSGASTVLDEDGDTSSHSGVTYTVTGQTVEAVIASVEPGQTGWLRFDVRVAPATLAGVIENTVTTAYHDGSTTVNGTTNTPTFTVQPTAGVTLSDDGSTDDASHIGPGGDEDGAADDVVTRLTATQGETIYFRNVLTNTGNSVDTFDVTYSNGSFPAGSSFALLRSNGSPMVDSNGNATPDTGPLAPGDSFDVYLRVTLPTGAEGDNGGNGYTVIKTATSTVDSAVSDSVDDHLVTISASTVDLTNDAAGSGAPGAGIGPESTPVTTESVNPGQTASFTLFVNNTGPVADSYNLAASTDSAFGSAVLPAGWTVTFRNAGNNTVITNTGSIAAGAALEVVAEVSVPAGNAPVEGAGQSIYFRAQSPTSGATDIKHDAVIVNRVIDVAITPNRTGQGFPGGQVVYQHTLTNHGNIAVNAGELLADNSDALWISAIYLDDGDGVFSLADDTLVGNISDFPTVLGPGEEVRLWVRVSVPSGAAGGASNVTTVTVTNVTDIDGNPETALANNQVTDTTTVQTGQVQVVKRQAVDADCDGTADGAFVELPLSAEPGACLVYRITLTNLGSMPIDDTLISDQVPLHTTYVAAHTVTTPAATVTAPADGGTGMVEADFGTVASSASVELVFVVRINPLTP